MLFRSPTTPVIREWARPGEYERIRAKRIYKEACRKAKEGSLSPEERKETLKKAKKEYKSAKNEAKALKKASKGAKAPCE